MYTKATTDNVTKNKVHSVYYHILFHHHNCKFHEIYVQSDHGITLKNCWLGNLPISSQNTSM